MDNPPAPVDNPAPPAETVPLDALQDALRQTLEALWTLMNPTQIRATLPPSLANVMNEFNEPAVQGEVETFFHRLPPSIAIDVLIRTNKLSTRAASAAEERVTDAYMEQQTAETYAAELEVDLQETKEALEKSKKQLAHTQKLLEEAIHQAVVAQNEGYHLSHDLDQIKFEFNHSPLFALSRSIAGTHAEAAKRGMDDDTPRNIMLDHIGEAYKGLQSTLQNMGQSTAVFHSSSAVTCHFFDTLTHVMAPAMTKKEIRDIQLRTHRYMGTQPNAPYRKKSIGKKGNR